MILKKIILLPEYCFSIKQHSITLIWNRNWISPEIYARIHFDSTLQKNQLKSCDGKSCIDMKTYFESEK